MSTAHSTDPTASTLRLRVERPAHGGHCIARSNGQVVFVRHAIPGELVDAVVTGVGKGGRFLRADATTIVEESVDRVPHVWPMAGPNGVGGGELGHMALPAQRRFKHMVLVEQLRRLAKLSDEDLAGIVPEVEAIARDDEHNGLRYRTRFSVVTDSSGQVGMSKYRSNVGVPLSDMPLTMQLLTDAVFGGHDSWPANARIEAACTANPDDETVRIFVDGAPWVKGRVDRRDNAPSTLQHVVPVTVNAVTTSYSYRVSGVGFWQVHRHAAPVLAQHVVDETTRYAHDGLNVIDAYCGSGLFTAPLADLVGSSGHVWGIEGDKKAAASARRAVHAASWATITAGDVHKALSTMSVMDQADVVVLDPTRHGAGRDTMLAIATKRPRAIIYVACDPAALARDIAFAASHGYRLATLRSFDIFPHTHHFETVATLTR